MVRLVGAQLKPAPSAPFPRPLTGITIPSSASPTYVWEFFPEFAHRDRKDDGSKCNKRLSSCKERLGEERACCAKCLGEEDGRVGPVGPRKTGATPPTLKSVPVTHDPPK